MNSSFFRITRPVYRMQTRHRSTKSTNQAVAKKDAIIIENDDVLTIERAGVYLIRIRMNGGAGAAPLPCLAANGSLLSGMIYDPPHLGQPHSASGWLLTRLTQGCKLELVDHSPPLTQFQQGPDLNERPASTQSWEITLERVGH
ncbi:hypothetical protein [Paenibacillus herberti]|uniref:Uncharacterized protein n=1 Tax=Paenibacillus herberti TaxID=1619309 RepID=A0A229NU77_9BACL|nr:hypothetical protein [Paenibacillus herberti]OXM13466.1 hypothetical protein CGZ75_20705 [Paenibacillus herberti]